MAPQVAVQSVGVQPIGCCDSCNSVSNQGQSQLRGRRLKPGLQRSGREIEPIFAEELARFVNSCRRFLRCEELIILRTHSFKFSLKQVDRVYCRSGIVHVQCSIRCHYWSRSSYAAQDEFETVLRLLNSVPAERSQRADLSSLSGTAGVVTRDESSCF